jgi:hypothetical protein
MTITRACPAAASSASVSPVASATVIALRACGRLNTMWATLASIVVSTGGAGSATALIEGLCSSKDCAHRDAGAQRRPPRLDIVTHAGLSS